MGDYLNNFWKKTKTNLDIWFFFAFLLTFTFSVRKITSHFPIQKSFNEYTGIYIYLSDIFLFLAFFSWTIFILYNKKLLLSKIKLAIPQFIHSPALFLPLILGIWSLLSTVWSENHSIALFRSIKFFQFYFLYLYIIFRISPLFHTYPAYSNCSTSTPHIQIVPRGTIGICLGWNIFTVTIIISAISNSIIGIIQFISQKSIGLFFLKESLINPDTPGVAKIIINGEKWIRSYGLFPHPNILGGFLLFSIILTLFYYKHTFVPRGTNVKPSLARKEIESDLVNVPRGTNPTPSLISKGISQISHRVLQILLKIWIDRKKWLIIAILILQLYSLILTFSKSAILGLVISLGYIFIVPRGTITHQPEKKFSWIRNWQKIVSKIKLFHVEQFKKIILAISIVLLLFSLLPLNKNAFFIQSLQERIFYLNVSRGTILEHPILGLGMGQSVIKMASNYSNNLATWQFQPVHNVFLLIWLELGIIGLGLFIWFLLSLFHTPVSQKRVGGEVKNVPPASPAARRGINSSLILTRKGDGHEIKSNTSNNLILCNDKIILSNNTLMLYPRGILIGFIFIMLFDHYFWDIQQGSLIFWLTLGLIAGIERFRNN